jgi:hypothetical protein
MKKYLKRFICHLVILASVLVPYSAQTQAALIGTEQALAAAGARDRLHEFAARAEVREQLAARGLSSTVAAERIDALSDDEVQALAGRIDALPAGSDAGIGFLAALLLVVLFVMLLYMADSKKR